MSRAGAGRVSRAGVGQVSRAGVGQVSRAGVGQVSRAGEGDAGLAGEGDAGLAERQAELVAALVAGGPLPPGFDSGRVGAAREALLRKRSGEVAAVWPVLAASLGPQWTVVFTGWARDRAPNGALRDGWDLARQLAAEGRLPEPARTELRGREAHWRYDGISAPRHRSRLLTWARRSR